MGTSPIRRDQDEIRPPDLALIGPVVSGYSGNPAAFRNSEQDTPWQPNSFRYLTARQYLDGDFAPHTRIIHIADVIGSLRSQHGASTMKGGFVEKERYIHPPNYHSAG